MGVVDCIKPFIPAILGTIAVVTGTAGTIYCETIQFEQQGEHKGVLFGGVWGFRMRDYEPLHSNSTEFDDDWAYSTCHNYNHLDRTHDFDYDIDARTRTTMAFSMIAPILGGVALIFAVLGPCFGGRINSSTWMILGHMLMLTCLCQGLTLMIASSSLCEDNPVLQFLQENDPELHDTFGSECEMAAGHRLNITAVVFWFLAGAAVYVLPPPNIPRSAPTQTQTVTYQRNPDGTVEESHVAVVKGTSVPNGRERVEAAHFSVVDDDRKESQFVKE